MILALWAVVAESVPSKLKVPSGVQMQTSYLMLCSEIQLIPCMMMGSKEGLWSLMNSLYVSMGMLQRDFAVVLSLLGPLYFFLMMDIMNVS